MTLTLSPADQRILQITRDLCQKLGIHSISPTWISWHGYAPGGSILTGRLLTVPYDGCVFDDDTVVLAEGIRNELEPENWGPLIASELIYKDKFQGKLWGSLLRRLVTQTVLSILAGALLWLTGILNLRGTVSSQGNPVPVAGVYFTLLTMASVLLMFPSYFFLGLPFSKNLRLVADREALQVTGKTEFLTALTKVGRLIPGLMNGKRPDSRYPYDRPSIKRRIDAIQSTNSQLN